MSSKCLDTPLIRLKATMPVYVLPIHSTLGALYIGMVLATSLHGISILQAWFYYRHQNDRWPLKTLVTTVMVSDTIHEILIVHGVYILTITDWGQSDKIFDIIPTIVLAILFNGLTTLLVQGFMTMRLWRLNHNIPVLIFTVLLVLAQFATYFSMSVLAIQRNSLIDLVDLKPLSYAMIIIAAVGDVFIAGAMCYVLRINRTGYHRSDSMINKLIIFTVNTGLLTGLYAVASFIAYMTNPASFTNIAFSFSIGRLYTNALLATLNARKMIRGSCDYIHNVDTVPNLGDRVTLSLPELSTSGNSSRQRGAPSSISIKIDTTKESATDFKHDRERDPEMGKAVRLQPSSSSLTHDPELEPKQSDNS